MSIAVYSYLQEGESEEATKQFLGSGVWRLKTNMQNRPVAHTIINATRYQAVDDEPAKYAGLVESVRQAVYYW